VNPRRVHDLVRKHFPPIDFVAHEWANVADNTGPRLADITALLDRCIAAPELVVELNRKEGGYFSKADALTFICTNIGKGHIRISDREFTSFVVIASNGVATGWKPTSA